MLPKQKRAETLGRFQRLLNSLPTQTKLTAQKTQKTLEIAENHLTTTYYRFFIETQEPLDWLIEQCGFKQQPLTELPKTPITQTSTNYLTLENGKLQKTFTVYQLPGTLLPGFVSELYGLCERVLICIKPLSPEAASAQMGKYLRLLKSIILADQTKGRLTKDEIKHKHNMAQTTYQNLITATTRLFELKINLTIEADNLKELKINTKKLKDTLQSRFIRLDCPAYMQQQLVQGEIAKKLVVDTTTASAFFPFVSADLVESPGGVFLGINQLTGAPVMFDPHLRMNQNILILGKSGSGKSFTSKIILTRLLQKHKNLAYYIVDPENEYGQVARCSGAEVLNITTEKQLGLDPIQIFSDNKDTAAAILADLTGIEDHRSYQELRTIVGTSHDLLEVYQTSPPNLKDRLDPFVTGSDSFLTLGQPQTFSQRMVFNLSGLHRQLALTQRRSLTFQAANSEPTVFVGGYLWSLAISPDGKYVYVTNSEAVSVIDISANKLLTSIKTGDKPWAAATSPDGKYIYVINRDLYYAQLDVPYVLPDGRQLFEATVMNASLSVISTATNTVVATVMGIDDPLALAVSPDGKYVYVLDNKPSEVAVGGGGDLLVINTATNSISSVLSFIDGTPLDLVVSPDGKYVYFTQGTGFVSVVDITTNTRIARISFGYGNGINYLAISPDGAFLYVAGFTDYLTGTLGVYVVDTKTNTIVTAISGLGAPNGLTVSPDGKYVYVTEVWNNTVSVINTNTNRVEYTISAGVNYPQGIVISPDGKALYVANNVYAPKKDCEFGVDYFGTVLTIRIDPNVIGTTASSSASAVESSNSDIYVAAQNVGNADSNTADYADSFVPFNPLQSLIIVLVSCVVAAGLLAVVRIKCGSAKNVSKL